MTIERQLEGLRRPAPAYLLEAVELGVGLVDGYQVFDSPLGLVAVAFNPGGVSAVDLADGGFPDRFLARFGRRLRSAAPPGPWISRIERALEQGRPGSLPVDLRSVTAFQRKILEIAATIPRGEVRPYSWLARIAGRPGASRAVGSTMARNPVPLIVPCHRVVRSDGHIGNYSLGGSQNKWNLLNAEGAHPADLEALAADGVRFVGSNTTRIYCYPTCRQARRITGGHRRLFHTSGEAEAAGYRSCRVCRPSEDDLTPI
jgi:O-6-methylguanine DNA methyltransferase